MTIFDDNFLMTIFDDIETIFDNWKDSPGDLTFETLITILTIENLNSWQSLLFYNQEWQWTAFAILTMFNCSVHLNLHTVFSICMT